MCDIGLNVKGSVHYYYSPCVSNVITLNNYFLHTSERVTLPKTQGENFIRWIFHCNKAIKGWNKQDITGNIDFTYLAHFFVFS